MTRAHPAGPRHADVLPAQEAAGPIPHDGTALDALPAAVWPRHAVRGDDGVVRLAGVDVRDLAERHGQRMVGGGKCLLLGRYYAESPFVYFSLNPGFARDGSPLDPCSQGDFNVPFSNPEELRRQYVYLHNCQRFLMHHPDVGAWMSARVTSAFLVPWRTRNASELYALNRQSGGQLFAYARQLVRLIVHHHEARLLIAAGKSSIALLNDLGVPDETIHVEQFHGPGGSYQWSRSQAVIRGNKLAILQIPHFSRANSPAKLRGLGQWLRDELRSFDRDGCGCAAQPQNTQS